MTIEGGGDMSQDQAEGVGASASADRATHEPSPSVSAVPVGIPSADYAGNDFARGAQACREMMARFVEQGGDATTAASIRANWHPGWCEDPGAPPEVLDTWEAPECPEGEAAYEAYRKSVAEDDDHRPDTSPRGLSATAQMLERWAIPMLPANRLGQVPFLRGLIECAIRDLRAVAIRDGGFLGPTLAQAIEARRAETGTGSVVGESPVRDSGCARTAQPPVPSSPSITGEEG